MRSMPGMVVFRAAYFISTVKHNEMLRDGKGEEIDATIKQGRLAQAHILRDE